MNPRYIGILLALPGLAMVTSAMFLDDYLRAIGIGCTNPLVQPECLASLFLFWPGVILVGTGLVATMYWRLFLHQWEPDRSPSGARPESGLRRFLRWWVTPPKPINPNVQYPIRISRNLPAYVVMILFVFGWFAYAAPYSSITGSPLFWLAFLAISPWPLLIEIKTRDFPIGKEMKYVSDYAILFGASMIVLGILAHRDSELAPPAFGLLPGMIIGILVGGTYQILYRYRRGKGVTW